MDELCRFIEFWAGERRPEYGEPESELARRSLPEPLRRLYAFAGRWPRREPVALKYHSLNQLFAFQDRLAPFRDLETAEDGKLVFLYENQGVWDCRTLGAGDDPPVWIHGEICDEHRGWFTGERQECSSLSKFLVTFVLRELTFGSEGCLHDEHLQSLFLERIDEALPIWLDGPYVERRTSSFYLFEHLLVMHSLDSYWFGANSEAGRAFIEQNQARILCLILDAGFRWSLTISEDGSGVIRFSDAQVLLAHCPGGSFDFATSRDDLFQVISEEGSYTRNPTVSFPRAGRSTHHSKNVQDWDLVQALFQRAFQTAREWEGDLQHRVQVEWCSGALDQSTILKYPESMPLSLLRRFDRDNTESG